MNIMSDIRYTTAQTAPMVSGLYQNISTCYDLKFQEPYTYISGRLGFAISLPLSPAFKNTGPSHLIRLKATANTIPHNAIEATKGAPSPWNVLLSIAKPAPTRASRRQVSLRERVLEGCMADKRPRWQERGPSTAKRNSQGIDLCNKSKSHVGDAQSVFILQILDKLIVFCQTYLTAKFSGERVSRDACDQER